MSGLPRYVYGIDPSLTETGIAGPDGDPFVVSTRTEDGDTRLDKIYRQLLGNIRAFHRHASTVLAIVEDLPTHAHGAGKTGMAQGAVRLALQHAGVTYVTVTAATVKKFASGSGNATKADMRMAWFKRTGEDVRNDNVVDALWLREIGRYAIGHREALELPRAQRECILKLAWPEAIAAHLLEPYERVVAG